ncbi:ankyrin repeat domain-containing protein 7-like [Gigantopelta aegis]|uniref:ankyrin repeat domain-containing protein 7-like n=1 Tax=Gigantopelta aegis TaxID=1735272 RepID=UPI001B887D15|nr:ankyrin repeat domain-containing protein 7-like [Gigantopelta aegis]
MVILRLLKQLLKQHADVNIQNKNGWTSLMIACQNGHTKIVEQLLKEHANVNIQNKEELLDSCVKGDLATVIMKSLDMDALIQAGADVNKQESHLGLTPLSFAISGSKSFSITESLLMYGAHPNVIADNSTPLDIAIVINEKALVVEQLLKEDADINIQNKKGVTALMIASANGHTQVIELLAKVLETLMFE